MLAKIIFGRFYLDRFLSILKTNQFSIFQPFILMHVLRMTGRHYVFSEEVVLAQ
jgi:hypothetical protein